MVTYKDIQAACSCEDYADVLARFQLLRTAELRQLLLEGPDVSRGLSFLQRWGPTLRSNEDRRNFLNVLSRLSLKAEDSIGSVLLETVQSLAKSLQTAVQAEAARLLVTWNRALHNASRCAIFQQSRNCRRMTYKVAFSLPEFDS